MKEAENKIKELRKALADKTSQLRLATMGPGAEQRWKEMEERCLANATMGRQNLYKELDETKDKVAKLTHDRAVL